jgi:hypothetical protein
MADEIDSFPRIVRVELALDLAETGESYWKDQGYVAKVVCRTVSAINAQERIYVVVLLGKKTS